MKDLSKIKCIVISGGGAMFFQMLGIFTEIIKNDTFDINNISDYYGCSAGSILSVMLALNHNIDTLNKYFIDRPWHNLIKTDIFQVLSSFNTCGIINKDILIKSYDPLFKAKDLDISTITLKDFYDKTKKIFIFIQLILLTVYSLSYLILHILIGCSLMHYTHLCVYLLLLNLLLKIINVILMVVLLIISLLISH